MSLKEAGVLWYQMPLKVVEAKLYSNLKTGLNHSQVEAHRRRYGANIIESGKQRNHFLLLLDQIKSPLVLVLLLAGVVTFALGEYANFFVIFAVVIANTAVGFTQEEKSARIFKDLSGNLKYFVPVIRNGDKKNINVEELIPGDLIALSAGELVPADARLVESHNLSTDEAILTGESAPVTKNAHELNEAGRITDQINMVWKSTLVTTGSGLALITATGAETEIGKIARLTENLNETETPFQKSIKKLSYFLTLVVAGATLIIFLLGYLRGIAWWDSLLTALAVAVAAIPSGLPIAVTVVLAFGVQAIFKKGGLVKNLSAVETLGGVSTIMTDKTGTLTKAEMSVEVIVPRSEAVSDRRDILAMALMSSEGFVEHGEEAKIIGRPIERAIIKAGLDIGLNQNDLFEREPQLDFLPFDSRRRFSASLNQGEGRKKRIYVTGAPELFLNQAKYFYDNGKPKLFAKIHQQYFHNILNTHAKQMIRFVATGYLSANQTTNLTHNQTLDGLVFGGLIGVRDELRADARESIKIAELAGARVVMVTGDNELTAMAVARELAISNNESSFLSGVELEIPEGEPVVPTINDTRVFARMLPEQKLNLLKYYQADGEIVAMTGDGVNDAPALKHADIGIALGSGTAVAKAASDLVLVNNSFSTIISAIAEGRRILDNLKKIVAYLLSTGFSEIVLVGGALLFGAPLPLFPIQIIWNNIIGESLMTFAFAFEEAEDDVMRRHPRQTDLRRVLTPNLIFLIIVIATITGLISLLTYLFLLKNGLALDKLRSIMFVILSLDSLYFSFSLKNLKRPIWKIKPLSNHYLVVSFFASLGILLFTFIIPGLSKILSLVPLSLMEVLLIFVLGLVNLLLIELVKFISFSSGWFDGKIEINNQKIDF
ncbi:MAG: HAD-IC family P-type ATPase [Patescibacteria group bacterium]